MDTGLTLLCISCYFKGEEFLRAAAEAGNRVFLLTSHNLKNKPWPHEALSGIFYVQEQNDMSWDMDKLAGEMAVFLRHNPVDRLIALDDFDVERVAELREVFRIPGMGSTTARYFRDKLAMRMKAQEGGIPIPTFTATFHDRDINAYAAATPAPWLIKPRSQASATGIQKVHSHPELWEKIHALGDVRHEYLIEKFSPGKVYHVDSIILEGKVLFSLSSEYLDTPMEVAHGGGIFRSQSLVIDGEEDTALQKINADVLRVFGMRDGVSHSEFIRSNETGEFLFLETSSRVGGAHLAEMVEAASGINLWREWARLETAVAHKQPYALPEVQQMYAGIIVSLSRFEHPDYSTFNDTEVCWRMEKDYHVGLILRSPSRERVRQLLQDYAQRIAKDFHASLPIAPRPTH
ncbi:MAG: acetyl-CoA carboxylase biotin carboxylase subunit family protein [Bernardetiaceae bacterium]